MGHQVLPAKPPHWPSLCHLHTTVSTFKCVGLLISLFLKKCFPGMGSSNRHTQAEVWTCGSFPVVHFPHYQHRLPHLEVKMGSHLSALMKYGQNGPSSSSGVTVSDSVCFQGKGIPDLNTRLLVKKLWDTFHIPVFTLVDADPYGNPSWTVWDNSHDCVVL